MKHLFQFRSNNLIFITCAFMIIGCSKNEKSIADKNATALSQSENANLAAAGIDTTGLVAWYNFNNGSLKDASQYNNRIVFNNAAPATDRNGEANNAYHFNGTNNYMRVKNSESLNTGAQITMFAIVKFDDFYAGTCHGNRIFFKGDGDFQPGVYGLGADDGYTHNNGLNCYLDVDKTHESFEGSFNVTGMYDPTQFVQTGRWYHLVYTYANGTAKFFVDGIQVNSQQIHIAPTGNQSDLFIGCLANTGYPYWLNGSIDQIGIFNKAANNNQVARLSAY